MAAAAPDGDGAVLVLQTATLSTHAPGLPAAGTPPGRQLAGATVRTEVYGIQKGDPSYFPDIQVRLAGLPDTDYDDDARLTVAFGHHGAGGCEPSEHYQRVYTSGRDGSSYHVGGYTPDYWNGTPDRPWECLYVILGSVDGQTVYDAMHGDLVNAYESPAVEVVGVELLGKKQQQLRLVRGAWTTVSLELRNSGPAPSQSLTVTGAGKGLAVRKVSLDGIRSEGESSVSLRIKPTGKKKTGPLTLRVEGVGVDLSHRIKVRAVAPPPKPRAGRYRSPDGRVHFSIRNGRVVGWHGTMKTQCGGFGSIPTYTQNTYDFPKVKVPRNGILQASRTGAASGNDWSTFLQMQVRGAKVTHGVFRYGTAGPCTAAVGFTAKRVGR